MRKIIKFKNFNSNILNFEIQHIAQKISEKYEDLLFLIIIIMSLFFINYISFIAIMIMDVIAKFILQKEMLNIAMIEFWGVVYILTIPIVIVIVIFKVRVFRMHILQYADYCKCAFNVIYFLSALNILKGQYWSTLDITNITDILLNNQFFWGISLIALFFSILLDYYLIKEKRNKVEKCR